MYQSYWIVNGDDAIWFDVVKDHLESPFSWVSNPGPVAPVLDWTLVRDGEPAMGGERDLTTKEAEV